MATDINAMYVVEWSPSQKQFHTQSVGEMIQSNLKAAIHQQDSDYIPIAITSTEDEADKLVIILEDEADKLAIILEEKFLQFHSNLVEDITGNLH